MDVLTIENTRFKFKNFSGNKFGNGGASTFNVIIEDANDAMQLKNDGWNIKEDDYDPENPVYHLPVEISFKYSKYAPNIHIVENGRMIGRIDENNIADLDDFDIESCDIQITPFEWERNGNSGVKAYLKSMYVVLHEDPLARKYRR